MVYFSFCCGTISYILVLVERGSVLKIFFSIMSLFFLLGCGNELIHFESIPLEIDSPIRKELPYSLNSKFLDSIQYMSPPDPLTKEITEFIFYVTFNGPFTQSFESVELADKDTLLINALLSTSYIDSQSISDQEQLNYLESEGLNFYILREHLVKTSELLYGDLIGLPSDTITSPFQWKESLYAYEVFGRGIDIYNPVVLSIEESEDHYEIVAVFPRTVLYEIEAYVGDITTEDSTVYYSLKDVIPHCRKSKFILTKDENEHFTLSSHYLLNE